MMFVWCCSLCIGTLKCIIPCLLCSDVLLHCVAAFSAHPIQLWLLASYTLQLFYILYRVICLCEKFVREIMEEHGRT